jgi:hypothetical protein
VSFNQQVWYVGSPDRKGGNKPAGFTRDVEQAMLDDEGFPIIPTNQAQAMATQASKEFMRARMEPLWMQMEAIHHQSMNTPGLQTIALIDACIGMEIAMAIIKYPRMYERDPEVAQEKIHQELMTRMGIKEDE